LNCCKLTPPGREKTRSTLAGRYVNLIYSAALRQTSDTHAAKDITQAVFLTLARKAGSICRQTILAGWLLRTTRFAAANARRLNQRREYYEQLAMHSYVCPTESEAAWHRIAPFLDDALDQLNGKDRDAVVLRFFEQFLRHIPFRCMVSLASGLPASTATS
jgi:DNA-directed RNA polymerase specialized sigma24 family protein